MNILLLWYVLFIVIIYLFYVFRQRYLKLKYIGKFNYIGLMLRKEMNLPVKYWWKILYLQEQINAIALQSNIEIVDLIFVSHKRLIKLSTVASGRYVIRLGHDLDVVNYYKEN